MRGKGINDDGLSINWADLMKHKHGFTDPTPQNMEDSLTNSGVTTLHGSAAFVDRHQLDVDGTLYEARNFLIATGAIPRPLNFPGSEHLIDSTDFLNLQNLPPRVLFIGGGLISFEFAHIAARAGASPVIIDRGERPLNGFDPDLVELLVKRGIPAGIHVRHSSTVTAVEKTTSGYRVTLEQSGVPSSIDTDLVVHGAGRIPELSGLNLKAAGIAASKHGVSVTDHLQSTTNPAAYAAGDAADTPGMPLTPVAVLEGKVAASNMLKGTMIIPDYTGVPTTVFSIPELSRVGMLEHEARDKGFDLDIRYTDTSDWYSNYRIGETTAATKILINRATGRIIGAHMFGPGYGELINFLGLAMKLDLTTRQLKSMVATYPSVASDLGSML